jgi:hypothetical protein
MQKVLIGILAITTTALGIFCVVQSRQLRASNERLRAVEEAQTAESETHKARSARVKELETPNERLEEDPQEVTAVTSLPSTGKAPERRGRMPQTWDKQRRQTIL